MEILTTPLVKNVSNLATLGSAASANLDAGVPIPKVMRASSTGGVVGIASATSGAAARAPPTSTSGRPRIPRHPLATAPATARPAASSSSQGACNTLPVPVIPSLTARKAAGLIASGARLPTTRAKGVAAALSPPPARYGAPVKPIPPSVSAASQYPGPLSLTS